MGFQNINVMLSPPHSWVCLLALQTKRQGIVLQISASEAPPSPTSKSFLPHQAKCRSRVSLLKIIQHRAKQHAPRKYYVFNLKLCAEQRAAQTLEPASISGHKFCSRHILTPQVTGKTTAIIPLKNGAQTAEEQYRRVGPEHKNR